MNDPITFVVVTHSLPNERTNEQTNERTNDVNSKSKARLRVTKSNECLFGSSPSSFVRSFVRSEVRSFVCFEVRSFVRSFVCFEVRSFVPKFVHSFTRCGRCCCCGCCCCCKVVAVVCRHCTCTLRVLGDVMSCRLCVLLALPCLSVLVTRCRAVTVRFVLSYVVRSFVRSFVCKLVGGCTHARTKDTQCMHAINHVQEVRTADATRELLRGEARLHRRSVDGTNGRMRLPCVDAQCLHEQRKGRLTKVAS